MQNLPRIFIDQTLEIGKAIPLTRDQTHYLTKVMRTDKCLVFNNGVEFMAQITPDSALLNPTCATAHSDPSNNLTFAFAPIKQSRMEEMLNMATQMGAAKLQPVITARTTEKFPKWDRIRKIIIEAAEQSGRNNVPELLPAQKFAEFLERKKEEGIKVAFADERFAHTERKKEKGIKENSVIPSTFCLLIGPEGGFSPQEFAALDESGAIGFSLGKTILRAETAAVAGLARILTM